MQLQDGRQMRIQLPFAPAFPLPKLALDALAAVLPSASWYLLFSCQLAAPGESVTLLCCQAAERTWQYIHD